jgi:hypothetical protein
MRQDDIDDATKSEITKARALIKKAAEIVQRTNVSKRAMELLGNADFHLSHPQPVLYKELPSLCPEETKRSGHLVFPPGFDHGHVYFDLPDAVEVSGLSRTSIRKLVNDQYMEQPYRGLYRVHDFLRAIQDFFSQERNS